MGDLHKSVLQFSNSLEYNISLAVRNCESKSQDQDVKYTLHQILQFKQTLHACTSLSDRTWHMHACKSHHQTP